MTRHDVEQAERWDPWRPSVVMQGGPVRVVNDEPSDVEPRPVGFRQPERQPESPTESPSWPVGLCDCMHHTGPHPGPAPLLWEGDQA